MRWREATDTDGRGHRDGRGGRGSRGRGRAQRGDLRAAVLLLLADQPMHGYQLMRAITERTAGAWEPSPGAVYPTISQLEDEELVTVLAESGRKLVTLTDAGRAYLAANQDSMVDPFDSVRSPAAAMLRGPVEQVQAAARAVGHSGTPEQITEAQRLLDETRRSLYLLLAEGPAAAADTTDAPPEEAGGQS